MNTPLLPLCLLALLLGAGLLAARLRQQALRRQTHAWLDTLHTALELLQRVQKHRGLGGRTEARAQCQALAGEIDGLWRRCPQNELALAELDGQWRALRQTPDNFAGHCQLIDRLLNLIEQLELRLERRQARVRGLARACRELEDLARLRGLAVRGAAHPSCPLELQVQMRYLCQRLGGANSDPLWRDSLLCLRDELIDAQRSTLRPEDCFALLTPLIDRRLQQIHLSLG